MTGNALKSPGDTVDHGTYTTRYGMTGDRYLSSEEIGERMEALDTNARRLGKPEWIVQIAVRVRLAEQGVGYLDALQILAKADVTWSDICSMKS